jgi:hypothetical protein
MHYLLLSHWPTALPGPNGTPLKIQPLTKPKQKLTAAKKVTHKIASAWRKESQAALNTTIAKYLQQRAEKFKEMAAEHNVKVSKIAAMVEASTHYKKECQVTLQNAIVHFMSEKIIRSKFASCSSKVFNY